MLQRAQVCLLGQFIGDALGSLVEFKSVDEIHALYPDGVRDLVDGGTWNTIAGQLTDDSEMALMLAQTLIEHQRYQSNEALNAYQFWLDSQPFDCGMTVAMGLRGVLLNPNSQANGALMRISPLGVFGAKYSLHEVGAWAMEDAALTHPYPICLQKNALFAMAIAYAVSSACDAQTLYAQIKQWALELKVENALLKTIELAKDEAPPNYVTQQGWVLIAFHNALWQLLHAPNFEEALVSTIMYGRIPIPMQPFVGHCWIGC